MARSKKTKISSVELIKKLRSERDSLELEKKSLINEKENLEEEKENLYSSIVKLKKSLEEKNLYVKGFEVLVSCADFKRLAWRLANEYDRQKRESENRIRGNDFLKDILKPNPSRFDKIEKKNSSNELNINLDLNKMLEELF